MNPFPSSGSEDDRDDNGARSDHDEAGQDEVNLPAANGVDEGEDEGSSDSDGDGSTDDDSDMSGVEVEGVYATEEDDLEGMDLATLSRDLDQFHENEAVQEALAQNVDLTEYSRTTDAELAELQETVVAHHFKEADNVAELALEMDKCGDLLEKMQGMLQAFQKSLSQVSSEMRRLQGSCEDLDTKLKNRRVVEQQMRKFIERIIVSPAMKSTIEFSAVKDPKFKKALAVLDEKISFIRLGGDDEDDDDDDEDDDDEDDEEEDDDDDDESDDDGDDEDEENEANPFGSDSDDDGQKKKKKTKKMKKMKRKTMKRKNKEDEGGGGGGPSRPRARSEFECKWLGQGMRPANCLSVKQVLPELESLRLLAVSRIQEFFVSIFTDIRQAEGEQGAQMMLQNSLQKHTVMLTFLRAHAPAVVQVLQTSYTKTIERLFGNTFKTYLQSLLRAGQQADGKNDLIVVDEHSRKKSLFSTKVDMTRQSNSFVLGPRIKVLDDLSGFLPVTAEEAAKDHLRIEFLFRSFLKRLKETAILETEFLVRFFGNEHTNEMFQKMFARVFSDCCKVVADYVEKNYDMVGILLVVVLIAKYSEGRGDAEKFLRPFFSDILSQLNARFDATVEAQLENLKTANPKRMGAVDLHPHVASRRFAELAICVHRLKALIFEVQGKQHADIEIQLEFIPMTLISCLSELTMRFVELLRRLSGLHSKVKSKMVFLINNLDQVLQSFKTEEIEFSELKMLRGLHEQSCAQFVTEQLAAHFPHLHTFVKQLRDDYAASKAKAVGGSGSGSGGGGGGGGGGGSGAAKTNDNNMLTEVATMPPLSRKLAGMIEKVVTTFAASWKTALRDTDKEIVQLFSNYRQGTEVLKRILEAVITSYAVFTKAAERHFEREGKKPLFMSQIIRQNDIITEMRKYSRNI